VRRERILLARVEIRGCARPCRDGRSRRAFGAGLIIPT
jgi:hypothetical protein